MRKSRLLILLCVMVLTLSSCSPFSSNSSTANASTDGGNGSWDKKNWTRVESVVTDYTKLKDINSKDIPEIKLAVPIEPYIHVVKETSDGFLCGNKIPPETADGSQHNKTSPIIRKFGKDGKLLWESEYRYETYSGRVNNLLVYPDDSFLFSVQTYPYYIDNNLVSEKCYLVRCDKNGKELWKQDFENFQGEVLSNLFLSKDNELIAVGNYDKDSTGSDIIIMKLDEKGNIVQEKRFGGSDFDYIKSVKYDKELGIVISGSTQSNDGDFAMDKPLRNIDFIARIDESLNLKWVIHIADKESLFQDQFIISNRCIYFTSNYKSNDTSSTNMVYLVKLDENGSRVWTKPSLYVGMWSRAIAVLQNGDIACSSGRQNLGAIVVIDQAGNEKKRIDGLKYAPRDITPTEDGGFIVTSVREIRTVPQPPYISSIWYDTELVAEKFKSDYKTEWRKTYDKYKDELGYDFALPLSSGEIVVDSR